MTRWIDIPPVWLAGFLALTFLQSRLYPMALTRDGDWPVFLGGALVGSGVTFLLLAVLEMRRHRTTVLPRQEAGKLVTSGIFARSRNPIYLGDTLILTGVIVALEAVPSLVLLPIFMWLIEERFILREEEMLRRKFPVEFSAYIRKARRWI